MDGNCRWKCWIYHSVFWHATKSRHHKESRFIRNLAMSRLHTERHNNNYHTTEWPIHPYVFTVFQFTWIYIHPQSVSHAEPLIHLGLSLASISSCSSFKKKLKFIMILITRLFHKATDQWLVIQQFVSLLCDGWELKRNCSHCNYLQKEKYEFLSLQHWMT